MKQLLYIIPILFCLNCGDIHHEPTLWQELEGAWARTDNPNWHYQFGKDFATDWIHAFGSTPVSHWYYMEEIGDRHLMLIETNTKDTLFWVVSPIDSIVTIADATNLQTVYFSLKRQ